MKSIRTLNDCAEKERQKAQNYLDQAEKERSKNRTNISQSGVDSIDQHIMECDTQAVNHEKLAQGFEQQAKSLEAEANKLSLKKTEIIRIARLRVEELEAQEKSLRG